MDHAAGVGIGHRLRDGREYRKEAGQVLGRGRPGRQQSRPAFVPSTSFMLKIRPLVGERPQLVDRHDAGMLQLAADLRLLDEPAD